jgi:hypothetical protein
MRANDAGCGKLTGQVFDIGYRSRLHIQNSNAGTVLGNAGAQFPQGLDLADRTEGVG